MSIGRHSKQTLTENDPILHTEDTLQLSLNQQFQSDTIPQTKKKTALSPKILSKTSGIRVNTDITNSNSPKEQLPSLTVDSPKSATDVKIEKIKQLTTQTSTHTSSTPSRMSTKNRLNSWAAPLGYLGLALMITGLALFIFFGLGSPLCLIGAGLMVSGGVVGLGTGCLPKDKISTQKNFHHEMQPALGDTTLNDKTSVASKQNLSAHVAVAAKRVDPKDAVGSWDPRLMATKTIASTNSFNKTNQLRTSPVAQPNKSSR